jgi:scyllo-inositol 2-dehydrogenase (NADP+)
MTKVAIVGLGKMGVSHLAIANAIDGMEVLRVCDSSTLLGEMVQKYCGLAYEADYDRLLDTPGLDALVIATPSRLHEKMIRSAFAAGKHVFCEKPLTLSAAVSESLAQEAAAKGLVAQVGYHNRFVAAFREAKRLIDIGAIGRITHVTGEAYGPVVLKPSAATWRSKSSEGGGCLYDYAAHPINLMNWYFGRPSECLGAILSNPLSAEVDDAVYATLRFPGGVTGQVSVNWSDGSVRKMTTRITIWGDKGRLYVDRQELQLYVAADHTPPPGYDHGWTVKYTTDLTPPVSYYLRGEEYSAQMESFAASVAARDPSNENDFRGAADTDYTIDLIRRTALGEQVAASSATVAQPRASGLGRLFGRR